MLDQHRDYVLRTVEERGVRLVRLWFTDVLGNLKSFAISPAELENALEDGMTFDGSSIDGFSRIQEADVLAVPDPDTFELIPWSEPGAAEARVFCDIHSLDGTPFEGDPRQVLRRHVKAAHDQGFTFYIAPDVEFFYFEQPAEGKKPQPLDHGGYFDLTTRDAAGDLRKETIRKLEQMSIPVEYSFHEDSPSQQEIDLRHTDALTMADSVMTFRLVVKEVAASQGVHATFMPKPLEGVQGSGMHVHLSLFRGDDNAFYDADDAHHLSPIAKSFMAGLLRARRRDHGGHQPDGQQLQAARAGLRGTGPHQLGPQQPQRSDPGPDRQEGQPDGDPHRVPLARPGVQPVPRLQPDARGRHARHRAGLRAARRGRRQPVRDRTTHVLAKLGITQLPTVAVRCTARRWRSRARARGARRAHLRMVPAQQAHASGATTRPTSASSNSIDI